MISNQLILFSEISSLKEMHRSDSNNTKTACQKFDTQYYTSQKTVRFTVGVSNKTKLCLKLYINLSNSEQNSYTFVSF